MNGMGWESEGWCLGKHLGKPKKQLRGTEKRWKKRDTKQGKGGQKFGSESGPRSWQTKVNLKEKGKHWDGEKKEGEDPLGGETEQERNAGG